MVVNSTTKLDRRDLLQLLAASGAIVAMPSLAAATRSRTTSTIIGAAQTTDGKHQVVGFTVNGTNRFEHELPGRGHGFAISPDGRLCAVFARRPGRFLFLVDLASGQLLSKHQASSDRHFYGHGVFSADGNALYTTENDFAGERGIIGIWNLEDDRLNRTGEIESGGLGPHEIRFMPDGRTLAIANGGILTSPDSGSAKLNIPTMQPNLAFIAAETGSIRARLSLPPHLHKLSIRHIDVNETGTVAVAMQYHGPRSDLVPLIAVSANGGPLQTLQAAEMVQQNMKHYVGSIRWDQSGDYIAATCPRADRCTFWSVSGGYEGEVALADVCAIAPGPKPAQFVIAGGKGDLVLVEKGRILTALTQPGKANPAWDNHFGAA